MYGSGNKETAKIKCEKCKKFILYESIIKIYGPDEHIAWNGKKHLKPRYYCCECIKNN